MRAANTSASGGGTAAVPLNIHTSAPANAPWMIRPKPVTAVEVGSHTRNTRPMEQTVKRSKATGGAVGAKVTKITARKVREIGILSTLKVSV